MARYFLDTAGGRKGPFSPEQIADAIKREAVPLGARAIEEHTGRLLKAAEVAKLASPSDSGTQPLATGQPAPGPEPRFQPRTLPRARPPGARPVQASPQPQPATYPQQQPYPAQGQHYPQQPAYPQYSQQPSPYPQYPPQPGTYPYNAHQPMPHAYYVPVVKTSGYATASLICSLATLAVALPTCILGVIFGFVALRECKPNGPKDGRTMALIGLWLGVILSAGYALAVAGLIMLFSQLP